MRSSLVMTLIGAVSMAAALLVGCGDNDAKPVSSKAGQSCVRTADCADGLSCIANVCYKTAPSSSGGDGGTGGAPVVGPVLGGQGESCTSRRDCEDGLACFNQRCTQSAATGAGGDKNGGTPVAQLGDRGETCRVNADCGTGLVCVPGYITSGIGQCDLATYGYVPTGKACVGECATADDCCELPPAEHTNAISSCQDIVDALGATNCASATITAANSTLCYLQNVYCSCAKNTWTCDANSRCQYVPKCTVATETLKGCPGHSRANFPIPACDVATQKCQAAAPLNPACTKDADCDTNGVVFDSTDTCTAGECTCYANNCYRKCTKDIDCAANLMCDTKTTNLCVPRTGCSTDLDCASALGGRVGDTCVDSACKRPCTTDHQCSGSGIIASGSFQSVVCSAAGFCESVAGECSTDDQCRTGLTGDGLSQGVKPFCVTKPTFTPGVVVSSAITN